MYKMSTSADPSSIQLSITIYILCSVIALILLALYIFIRINFQRPCIVDFLKCCASFGTERDLDDEVYLPPMHMRKAPPPTLPDGIRALGMTHTQVQQLPKLNVFDEVNGTPKFTAHSTQKSAAGDNPASNPRGNPLFSIQTPKQQPAKNTEEQWYTFGRSSASTWNSSGVF